jgi:hypothetical protein
MKLTYSAPGWDVPRRVPGRRASRFDPANGKLRARERGSLPAGGFLLVLLAGILSASAQSYSIDWFTVDGGSGTSTGGVYSVSGTIGQPDAGSAMTGGSFSLAGGFWSLYAVQTPGAPLLTIGYGGNQAIVSWPPSVTGWTLQTNNNLATGIWGDYAGAVSNNRVTNSPPTGSVFFRLKQP